MTAINFVNLELDLSVMLYAFNIYTSFLLIIGAKAPYNLFLVIFYITLNIPLGGYVVASKYIRGRDPLFFTLEEVRND